MRVGMSLMWSTDGGASVASARTLAADGGLVVVFSARLSRERASSALRSSAVACGLASCGVVAVAMSVYHLAIPFVVLDDRWLSLIKVKQERRGLPSYGTEVSPGGYRSPPAHYFGVPAVGVDSAAGLARELRKALAADGPTIIEALIDPAHYAQTVFD